MNPVFSNLRALPFLLPLAGLLLAAGGDGLCADEPASFTVDSRLGESAADGLQVHLECRSAATGVPLAMESAWLPRDGTTVFEVPVRQDEEGSCTVTAEAPPGVEMHFRGDGGSLVDIADDGCHFSGVQPGHANFCQIQVSSLATSITVFKKWIGATREEPDVQIELVCAGERIQDARSINAGKPGGWSLDLTDPEGVRCDVFETAREEFIPDAEDCRDILVLPGSQEECTMVNTKVVKMIEMLNRYGLVIMILVFMVVGMIAARRFVP